EAHLRRADRDIVGHGDTPFKRNKVVHSPRRAQAYRGTGKLVGSPDNQDHGRQIERVQSNAPCRSRRALVKACPVPPMPETNMRPSRGQPDGLRAISLERGVVKYAEGSCFVRFGDTHVLVTATLEDRLPPWLKGQARGWVTAEYGMLPRATSERTRREASAGKQSGRTIEIQRLIGRSLRAVLDLPALGERQVTIDCDVIQADGGTRTAAITGA